VAATLKFIDYNVAMTFILIIIIIITQDNDKRGDAGPMASTGFRIL